MTSEHYVLETGWDNLGNGWRMTCNCGWCTLPLSCLEYAGADMDDHFVEEDVYLKKPK